MKLLIPLIIILAFISTACSDSNSATAIPPTPKVTASVQVQLTSIPTATQTPSPSPTATEQPLPSETPTSTVPSPVQFEGESSYDILLQQMEFGDRWPGSQGHAWVGDYILEELGRQGWDAEEQTFEYMGVQGRNIIGRSNIGAGPVIILGAHYDTRRIADQTEGSTEAVPGAVDGASGVAVLLELARSLELDDLPNELWLAFFDLEDQGSGGMPGFTYIVGSTYMADNLTVSPQAMVLVDMVGDADQQLYYEGNSDRMLRFALWQIAADLGYGDTFIPEERYNILDDHLPFANLGIPSVDIIDFDYPYWHTVEDTADKASPESLERVGRTLEEWLENRLPSEGS